MIIIILTLLAGCVPSLIVFFWLRNYLRNSNPLYKKNCDRMLAAGFLTVFPVILFSGCTTVLVGVLGVKNTHPLLYAALNAFVILALSEELSKFFMFRRRINKIEGEHSWLDLIIYSTIVGIGFGLLESIVYVVGSNPAVLLIRGICVPHGGYAAIVGYFYGKSLKERKRGFAVFGILLAFLMHGFYDFGLADGVVDRSEAFGVITIVLAALNLVIIVALIIFLIKNKNNTKYTEPLKKTQMP